MAYSLGYRGVARDCLEIAQEQGRKAKEHWKMFEKALEEEEESRWLSEGGR